ncbi:MAG: RHS repeat-associated core domain-containing protein [Verrucomicrobiales bacterium]|nr:RHS repeat-associated core domain-containing protein [Verrucomicrobiales bacterium]
MRTPIDSVLYPDKYFEVRERDVPTKYVWNAEERVARVTGSLSTRPRVQRVRSWPGWNSISIAVSDALTGSSTAVPVADTWFRWSASLASFLPLDPAQAVTGPGVYWLRCSTQANWALLGNYLPPARRSIGTDGDFIQGGLERWSVVAPGIQGSLVWGFDASAGVGLAQFPYGWSSNPNRQLELAPGQVLYLRPSMVTDLPELNPISSVHYFHLDHIGSVALVTDGTGSREHSACRFPFGGVRRSDGQTSSDNAYGFVQKELDQESFLGYLEARYFQSAVARFLSVDPAAVLNESERTQRGLADPRLNPQMHLHGYGYAGNNPIRWTDADGLDATTPVLPTDGASLDRQRRNRIPLRSDNPNRPRAEIVIEHDRTQRRLSRTGESHRSSAETGLRWQVVAPTARVRRDGTVRSVRSPRVTVSLQTVYRRGANPQAYSAYGRGTTDDDTAAGNTSLRFHEAQHGRAYINYLLSHPLPEYHGAAGMTVDQFHEANRNFEQALQSYVNAARAYAGPPVDCVGVRASFCE